MVSSRVCLYKSANQNEHGKKTLKRRLVDLQRLVLSRPPSCLRLSPSPTGSSSLRLDETLCLISRRKYYHKMKTDSGEEMLLPNPPNILDSGILPLPWSLLLLWLPATQRLKIWKLIVCHVDDDVLQSKREEVPRQIQNDYENQQFSGGYVYCCRLQVDSKLRKWHPRLTVSQLLALSARCFEM